VQAPPRAALCRLVPVAAAGRRRTRSGGGAESDRQPIVRRAAPRRAAPPRPAQPALARLAAALAKLAARRARHRRLWGGGSRRRPGSPAAPRLGACTARRGDDEAAGAARLGATCAFSARYLRRVAGRLVPIGSDERSCFTL